MVNTIPKTFRPTMEEGDKVYLKPLGGIYQTKSWVEEHDIYTGDMYIAYDRATLLGS